MNEKNIRNFSIIAHIDHGKSFSHKAEALAGTLLIEHPRAK